MTSVLTPGDTCWRRERAGRAAFLIDTEAYFAAAFDAMSKARRSIFLLGWGFDPRTRLFPDGYDGPADPDEVGRILADLARARPELDIRILIWRSAFAISAQQEFFPHKARQWFKGTGVKFRLDDQVPFGACHHQKVLVIDDRVAFCGGGDISVDRWDTARHPDHDPRRIMPDQAYHAPRHEVMMAVDGEAAQALGELCRDRWRKATRETLAPPRDAGGDPWPDTVPPALTDVRVGIARTLPEWRDQPLADEIRRLTLACIAEAKESIYLENQYFTSPLITEALAQRLTEPDGPEVVLISTGHAPSWFDHFTMDRARGAMIWRLRAADIFGRLRTLWPATRGGKTVIVHSKTSVFDDRIVRVGSANLNNRSGGFDTECELAIQCDGDGDADLGGRVAIAAFRDRLAGHFMGVTGDALAKARADFGGLVPAIDALNKDGRLRPIEPPEVTRIGEFVAHYHLGDPQDTHDSWNPFRRRERLYAAVREMPVLAPPDGTRAELSSPAEASAQPPGPSKPPSLRRKPRNPSPAADGPTPPG